MADEKRLEITEEWIFEFDIGHDEEDDYVSLRKYGSVTDEIILRGHKARKVYKMWKKFREEIKNEY